MSIFTHVPEEEFTRMHAEMDRVRDEIKDLFADVKTVDEKAIKHLQSSYNTLVETFEKICALQKENKNGAALEWTPTIKELLGFLHKNIDSLKTSDHPKHVLQNMKPILHRIYDALHNMNADNGSLKQKELRKLLDQALTTISYIDKMDNTWMSLEDFLARETIR